jgi:hypothetical protein
MRINTPPNPSMPFSKPSARRSQPRFGIADPVIGGLIGMGLISIGASIFTYLDLRYKYDGIRPILKSLLDTADTKGISLVKTPEAGRDGTRMERKYTLNIGSTPCTFIEIEYTSPADSLIESKGTKHTFWILQNFDQKDSALELSMLTTPGKSRPEQILRMITHYNTPKEATDFTSKRIPSYVLRLMNQVHSRLVELHSQQALQTDGLDVLSTQPQLLKR